MSRLPTFCSRLGQARQAARRLTSALLLGAASVTAYAPLGWFPLLWLTLGGLFTLLITTKTKGFREGALLGAAFGFGLFIAGVSWVYVSLSLFGGMPTLLAGLATVLFCCVLAAYPALVGAVFVRFSPSLWWQRSLFFAALWTLSEWLRAWVFTGFPWLAVGYAQVPSSPLAGFAPLLGVFGVSLATALTAALSCETILRRINHARWSPWCPAVPLLTVVMLLSGGGLLRNQRWTVAQGAPLAVALLQGNVAQDLKWRPEKLNESLLTYYRLALDNPAQLTVLPETALPAFLEQVPGDYLDALKKLAERQQGDLLFGIPIGAQGQYANGAVSIGISPEQRYNKSHLVPFGEFVPPGFAWFLSLVNIPMSDFTPGNSKQPPMRIAGQKIAVNICYEDAFGEEIIRALPEATLLVNLSNVAWFGDSLAPAQHLQIAQMRALETGRMMLRATNTGMTAIIGVDGTVQGVLQPYTRAALRGEVQAYTGATPYVRWGNWPVIVLVLLLIAFLRRRNAVSSEAGD
ncbi:apolipoprotein N-acyltransferase [Propionivibrio sp.]|uniref:apolipoprotein N-acyltransferase n=1 Tax=Propionivibrio sp. TaxID=2212460 RepID=UPI00260BFC3A|nr:apolipoprotein N-acyltransferase [Propionivibrio sp.]